MCLFYRIFSQNINLYSKAKTMQEQKVTLIVASSLDDTMML